MPGVSDLRKILENTTSSDAAVSSDVLPLVYDELRSLAAHHMLRQDAGQTLQATALVHEAWLRLTKENSQLWSNRDHFFRAAAQAMRHILVDRARAKRRLKRGESAEKVDIHTLDLADATMDERVLLVDEVLEKLEKEEPEVARIVTLRFFGGLTEKEIATMNRVTERTVRRQWTYAKTRLFQLLREEADGSRS
jgi:RNA polymerase sigma factor (TIGR02999 family)